MTGSTQKLTRRDKLQLSLVLVFVLGLVLLVVVANRAAINARAAAAGPIAEDRTGRVWVAIGSSLAVLDAGGSLERLIELDSVGIVPPVAALTAIPDGTMAVGSRETGIIHYLTNEGMPAGILDPRTTAAGALFGAFHLVFDDRQDVLLIADTSHHRILALTRDGILRAHAGQADMQPGHLHFPNGLALDEWGNLHVANTNHGVVSSLDEKLVVIDGFMPYDSSGDAEGHYLPVFIGSDLRGNLYVTAHDSALETGSLWRITLPGANERFRFTLPAGFRPAALLVRENDLLLSDEQHFRLLRFDHDGTPLPDFGDDRFRELLAKFSFRAAFLPKVVSAGQVVLIACLLGLLVVLFRFRRRSLVSAEALLTAEPLRRTTFLRRFSYALPLTLILVLTAFIIPLVLSQVVRGIWMPLPFWLHWWYAVGIGIVILLGVALLPAWWYLRQLRRGHYHPVVQSLSGAVLRKFGQTVQMLTDGESIAMHAMARAGRGPAFVLLTPTRLFVLALSHFGNRILRIQVYRRASLGAARRVAPRLWRGLLTGRGAEFGIEFQFGNRAASQALHFSDPESAQIFFEAFGTAVPQSDTGQSSPGERCPSCAAPLPPSGPCAACGRKAPPVWPAPALSSLYPGLGQYYNHELLKGTLYLLLFSIFALPSLELGAAWILRLREVSMFQLAESAAFALFIWLLAVIDAFLTARRLRQRGWGLV